MKNLYEDSDILNSPVEAFLFDIQKYVFPVEAHWHYYIELIYILKGAVCVTCNQKTYALQEGQLIFLPPQAVHSIYSSSGKKQQVRYYVLKFDANRVHLSGEYLPKISTVFRSIAAADQFPIVFSQADFGNFSLLNFFEACTMEAAKKRYGYDSYLLSSLALFNIHLLRIWRSHGLVHETEQYEQDEDYSIHDILMYIDAHSSDTLKIETLANMCHMSYSYFAKTFHKLYGQSCKEYIEFVRLCKVENLLLFTDYDLNYISMETGFSDCSHLIRTFKRKYGLTPKKYRSIHKQA